MEGLITLASVWAISSGLFMAAYFFGAWRRNRAEAAIAAAVEEKEHAAEEGCSADDDGPVDRCDRCGDRHCGPCLPVHVVRRVRKRD